MVMSKSMKGSTRENVIEDQLSSLPEALLTHILSFLSTKESVSTSVLSTKWKNLFAFVPVLDFYVADLSYPNVERAVGFLEFVNRVLSLHDASCTVRKFRINMRIIPCNVSDVSSWINAAIRRNAQIIKVCVHLDGLPCPLPDGLFTCRVLVHLKLRGEFVFDVAGPVSLPSLKTIRITYCKFSNGDSAERLFSGCPVLEDLYLVSCYSCDGSVISISVLLLKRLSIHNLFRGCEFELNNVPNLETIYLNLYGDTIKCSSVNILKSLRKASIVVDGVEDYMNLQLVNKFVEVQFLSLCAYEMESLARDPFSLPMFNKLTTLELEVDFSCGWKFFPILLGRSPCLEQLKIKGVAFSNCGEEILENDNFSSKHIPLCFSRSLKEVNLCTFKGETVEYEWLGYLMKNAKGLETLTVFVSIVGEDSSYLENVRMNVLALPRNSKNFKLVVIECTDII